MRLNSLIHSKSEEIKNVKYLFILHCFDKIIPLLVAPYLMVTLGASGYGYIGFSMAIIQYLMLFTDFGFNLSATQRIAIAKERGNEELSRVFLSTLAAKIILLISGTLMGFALVITVPSFKEFTKTIFAMYPMVVGTVLTSSWFFQGIGKIRVSAIVTSISKLLVLPFTFVLVKGVEDYDLAAFIQGIAYFIAGCVNFILLIRLKLIKLIRIKLNDVFLEIKESFPLFLSSVATSAYTQLFTVILGLHANTAAVGRYSASERIMRALCFAIYSPINAAYYPKIASLSRNNADAAKKMIGKLSKLILLIMMFLSVLLFAFADPISSLLGKEYQDFSTLLRIMSFAPVPIALGAVFGQMGLVAMGDMHTKKLFQRVYVIAGAISLVAVFVLTNFFAETGAAVSLLITEYLVFIMMLMYYRKNICC